MSNLLKISLYGLYCQLLYFLTEDIHICLRCVNDNDPFGFPGMASQCQNT